MATTKTIATARGLLVSIAQHGAKIEQHMEALANLKGMDYAAFESCRGEFVAAYCSARGTTPEDKTANAAARKGWSRIMSGLGIEKPASESSAAVAKRAQRAAKPSAEKTASPAKGEVKASAIKHELSAIEAHLVSLFRRGRFADMIELVRSEAEKASPM